MSDVPRFADQVRGHAVATVLDPDAPLNDLEPLRGVIGGARVVGIGESAHHTPQFLRLRHRLLRFLAERCGFTAYALEAPLTEARAVDDWVHGGSGEVADVAASGIALGRGDHVEMHDHLRWMRTHNATAERPLSFAGVMPSSASLLPAIREVERHLRRADLDALPLLDAAMDVVRRFDDPTFRIFGRYEGLEQSARDALTAALSRLLARRESMAGHQRAAGRGREHTSALWCLRSAWHLDHFHRDLGGAGLAVGTAEFDHHAAEVVLGLLEDGGPDTRVVLAIHNTYLRRTPIVHEGAFSLFPTGYHLARALGEDYLVIAATALGGRAAHGRLDMEHPDSFEVLDVALPPPVEGSIEAASAGDGQVNTAPVIIAGTDPPVHDADTFQRIRMEGYVMDVPVFDAFDAVACVGSTTGPRTPPR